MFKESFLELLLASGVLRFGEFKTKSGRSSPYFFNTGRLDSGETMGRAAGLYAEAIAATFTSVDNLFGPAYKGIPLAVAGAEHLARRLGRDISFTFNRKEAKDHGEGGVFIGRPYSGSERVVVIEDVLTRGTSLHESLALLKGVGVKPIGIVVGVDREERGYTSLSAREEIETEYGVPVFALLTMREILERLYLRPMLDRVWLDEPLMAKIKAYLDVYGA